MQRTDVHATEERLIAPRCMIQISAHPALVAIYWMHFRVNLICIYFFGPQKYNNSTVFVIGGFQSQYRHI